MKASSFDSTGTKLVFSDVVLRVEVQDLKAMTVLGTKIGNLQDVVTTETLIAAEK